MTRQKLKRWISLLLAAIMLTTLLTSCSGDFTQEDGLPGGSGASSYAAEVIRLVNEIRTEQGLPELTTSSSLSKAAALRAEEIVTLYSHPSRSKLLLYRSAGLWNILSGGRRKHRGGSIYTFCSGQCLDELSRAQGQYFESQF